MAISVEEKKEQVCKLCLVTEKRTDATIDCAQCGLLCTPCDEGNHLTAKLKLHDRTPLFGYGIWSVPGRTGSNSNAAFWNYFWLCYTLDIFDCVFGIISFEAVF